MDMLRSYNWLLWCSMFPRKGRFLSGRGLGRDLRDSQGSTNQIEMYSFVAFGCGWPVVELHHLQ